MENAQQKQETLLQKASCKGRAKAIKNRPMSSF